MSVISYTSLQAVPAFNDPKVEKEKAQIFDRTQAGMTQPFGSDMCGAYALVAAATTLGKLPDNVTIEFPPKDSKIDAPYHSAELKKTDTFAELANKIYSVTGILDHNFNPIEAGGYNSPAALASVAMQLGLKVELIINEALNRKTIADVQKVRNGQKLNDTKAEQDAKAMSTQISWCETILTGQSNFWLQDPQFYPVVGKINQLAISLMTTFVGSQHWIAQSSDNTYFDSLRNFYPGKEYGRVGYPWAARPYMDSGIDLLLSNIYWEDCNKCVLVDHHPALVFSE